MKHLLKGILAAVVAFNCSVSDASAKLVALYQFNDQDNLGLDTSGESHDATNNGTTYTGDGFQDGAAVFNGSSYLRSTALNPNPASSPQLTWGAWVKPNLTNPNRTVISADNGSFDRTISIDSRGGTISWSAFTNTGSSVFGSGITPSTSSWVFLAAVYQEPTDSLVFYVNGSRFVTTSNFGVSNTFFDIGHNPGFAEYFSGSIDNVFVYDEALSVDAISDIYMNGYPAASPEPATAVLMGMGVMFCMSRYSRKRTS